MKLNVFGFSLGFPILILTAIIYTLVRWGTFAFNLTVLILTVTVLVGLMLGIIRRLARYALIESRSLVSPHDALFVRAHAIRRRMNLERASFYFLNRAAPPITFARALLGRRPSILISPRLLEALSPAEQDSILAHELAHAKKSHAVKALLVFIFYLFAGIELFLFAGSGLPQEWSSDIALSGILLAVVGIFFVGPFLRRSFELEADLMAAQIAGKEPLISALKKMQSTYSQSGHGRLRSLILASPAIAKRVERIKQVKSDSLK